MSRDPVFLVLKPTLGLGWLPESWWKEILGAVVLNLCDLTAFYTPRNALQYNHSPFVDPDFKDFILRKESAELRSGELEVNGLGRLKVQKNLGAILDLKGKVVYVKRLSRQDDFWQEMTTKDPVMAEKVAGWVNGKRWGRSKHQVCWAVGLLMCQEVVVAASKEEARDREGRGDIRLGSVTETLAATQGASISTGKAGDTTGSATSRKEKRDYFEVEGSDKYVFALELKVVSLVKGKPMPSEKGPKAIPGHQLGQGDDDDGVQPEDLRLQDVGEDMWENLLQEASEVPA